MQETPRTPIVELLLLALPTVAQMASYTVMQFIDTWMLSHHGGMAPTAASNSGMLAFSLISFGTGVLLVVNTLVSQSFGRDDFAQCGRYLWQGIWFGLIFGVALVPLRVFAGPMFAVFHHSPELAAMEASYYRIVLLSAAIKLISTAVGQFLLGINRPNAVLVSAMIGVSFNALAAWCIVLGHFGFRPMGVEGAAWAQNFGVTCEMITIGVLALQPSIRRQFHVLAMAIRPRQMAMLLRIGLPTGLQLSSDILAWAIFCNGVIGMLGVAAMAGNTFMLRYLVVSFMPAYGLAAAVTALVGRYIGAGRPDIAARRAHLGFAVTLVYVIACGLIFVFFRHQLMRAFIDDPEIVRIGSIYLIYGAIYELFDAMYITYNGALRGAGDTLVPTLVMAVLCWSISIAGGYAVVKWVPSMGVGGPWLMGCVYGAILGIYMIVRFNRGRWRDIHLDTNANSNVELASATLAPN
ncbi:MAG: MATE family efflux transporter [Planctomycetota bacterium]|nr:MATE family efflux transporter [Planctomycetota bacterium]